VPNSSSVAPRPLSIKGLSELTEPQAPRPFLTSPKRSLLNYSTSIRGDAVDSSSKPLNAKPVSPSNRMSILAVKLVKLEPLKRNGYR
jgi:hypothetical protein